MKWLPAAGAALVGAAIIGLAFCGAPSSDTSAPKSAETPPLSRSDKQAALDELDRLLDTPGQTASLEALNLLHERFGPNFARDPDLKTRWDRLVKKDRSERSGVFAEGSRRELETIWLPKIDEVSANAATLDDLWITVQLFSDTARAIEEAQSQGVPSEDISEFRARLSSVQERTFPHLRARYGKLVGAKLWENDVEVATSGARNTVITWVGGLFAANANIKSAQQAIDADLHRLRFKRSAYRWMLSGDGWQFRLETPGDAEIGYDRGQAFKPVRATTSSTLD